MNSVVAEKVKNIYFLPPISSCINYRSAWLKTQCVNSLVECGLRHMGKKYIDAS
ncbi:hypothetical protein KDA_03070 [Dictyobacter alpinus]|uniref:Uncharacterized protein n=1 Tax=Dictyobacter alpinus TaxID=2014873 RepID=A0A402B0E8_9CHLR|nr:hypothetical protein KDA_03070 [Dictyobacter alpinus]